MSKTAIRPLVPIGPGHQFIFYGDSCSGVPAAPHEETHARVNSVVARCDPPPEFIIFPGDEIVGLVSDEATLRAQWAYWMDVEMAWLDRDKTPVYHATGNHTTFDEMSERVFSEVMHHHPRNGPNGQEGLSYFIRRGDLLLVFVNTLWSGLGGEGHIELDWLEETFADNADARWTLVIGHHPAFPVNGYEGPYQRTIGYDYVAQLWSILKRHEVFAYLCSHILAFDVQCVDGVLQITSAGAGTAHRMPEGIEYLHCVQMALDADGLRYQVLDDAGDLREKLSWPPPELPGRETLKHGMNSVDWADGAARIRSLHLKGTSADHPTGKRKRLMSMIDTATGETSLWIGLVGLRQELTVILQPIPGRSPHQWRGPCFDPGQVIDLELLLHSDMGAGGILWRQFGSAAWTGFEGRSAWGPERLFWTNAILVGEGPGAEAQDGDASAVTISVGWAGH